MQFGSHVSGQYLYSDVSASVVLVGDPFGPFPPLAPKATGTRAKPRRTRVKASWAAIRLFTADLAFVALRLEWGLTARRYFIDCLSGGSNTHPSIGGHSFGTEGLLYRSRRRASAGTGRASTKRRVSANAQSLFAVKLNGVTTRIATA
jgi:hypothetical protein